MEPSPALALALLLAAAAIASANPAPPPPPPAIGCAVELVAMSTCLPHVAAPPNNPMPVPSATCCATFFSSLDGADGRATCLCHLVRDPLLLGFPINATRIVALFSHCNASDAADAASSFAETCRDLPVLPPFRDATPANASNQQSGVAEAPETASTDPEQKPESDAVTTETGRRPSPEAVIVASSGSVPVPFRSGEGLLLTGPLVLLPIPVFVLCLLGFL